MCVLSCPSQGLGSPQEGDPSITPLQRTGTGGPNQSEQNHHAGAPYSSLRLSPAQNLLGNVGGFFLSVMKV